MVYRYRRTADGGLEKSPLRKKDSGGSDYLVALPGKKPRHYRAPVILGIDNKPLRPPLLKIRGKKRA